MSDQLIIFDTTLRDGEQSPGASMTKDEKLRIARQLERMRQHHEIQALCVERQRIEVAVQRGGPGFAVCRRVVRRRRRGHRGCRKGIAAVDDLAQCDEDLLDSIIYEIHSLKALYRYLLKMAKEEGLQCAEISVFGREVI